VVKTAEVLLTAEGLLEQIKVFNLCQNESTDDAKTTLPGSALQILANGGNRKRSAAESTFTRDNDRGVIH